MGQQRTPKQKRDLVVGAMMLAAQSEGFVVDRNLLDQLLEKIKPEHLSENKWVGGGVEKKWQKAYLEIVFYTGVDTMVGTEYIPIEAN